MCLQIARTDVTATSLLRVGVCMSAEQASKNAAVERDSQNRRAAEIEKAKLKLAKLGRRFVCGLCVF